MLEETANLSRTVSPPHLEASPDSLTEGQVETVDEGLDIKMEEQICPDEKDKLIESLRQQIEEKYEELIDFTNGEPPWDRSMNEEDIFKFRASTWASTMKFLKRNAADLNKISMYLLGEKVSLAASGMDDVLLNSRHTTIRESINVRNLLVRMNILIREDFGYLYDRYACIKDFDRECFSFDLNPTVCQTETAQLNKLLLPGSNIVALIGYVGDIHTHFRFIQNSLHSTQRKLVDFLTSVCKFVNTLGFYDIREVHDRQFQVEFDSKSYLLCPPAVLMVNDEVKMVVCGKTHLLLPPDMVKDPNNINLDMGILNADLEQLLTYMILMECPRGAVTDLKTSMYLELDLDAIAKIMELGNSNGKPKLPFKIWSTNVGAIEPSSNESWFSWVLRGLKNGKQNQMKKLKHFYFRNYLADKMSLFCIDRHIIPSRIGLNYEDISVIQAGHCGKQIFKVPVSAVKPTSLELQDHEELVVKIFDPNTVAKPWPKKQGWVPPTGNHEHQYDCVRNCIEKLCRDPEFNNCFFDCSEVSGTIATPIGYFSGKCILSKYIETAPFPDDEETYKKVLKQVQVLHKHRIHHRDLGEDNVIYGKDDRVYIMGFTSAEMIDPKQEADYWLDDEWLKKTFLRFHGKKARR